MSTFVLYLVFAYLFDEVKYNVFSEIIFILVIVLNKNLCKSSVQCSNETHDMRLNKNKNKKIIGFYFQRSSYNDSRLFVNQLQ